MMVLANHALMLFFASTGYLRLEGWLARLSVSAVISIEWLFVLSGYLIGAMMIRSFESERPWLVSARDFWLRRWFRTLPNYYLFLLVNVALVYSGIATGVFDWKFIVFSQNLAWREAEPHFFGESWSLALDEWFYVLMPLMLGMLAWLKFKENKQKFLLVSAVLIFVPTFLRALHPAPADFFQWDSEVRRVTIHHLDATGWGVLAAVVNKWYRGWWTKNTGYKALAGIGAMGGGIFMVCTLLTPAAEAWVQPYFVSVFAITFMAAGTFLFMPWMTQKFQAAPAVGFVTGRISMYSYSIYLCHFPLIFIFLRVFSLDAGVSGAYLTGIVLLWLVCVLGCSAAIYHFFEGPVADMRERFTRRVDASPF